MTSKPDEQFEPIPESVKHGGRYPCTICIRVSDNVRKGLDADAKRTDISVSDAARGILETHYQNKQVVK